MRRLTLRLAVALLTFNLGLSAVSLLMVTRRRAPQLISVEENQPVRVARAEKRTYEQRMQASGYAGKYRACFGVFSSSDGMNFSSTNIYFRSHARAERELRKTLRTASEIIKRELILDREGRRSGQRVVAVFAPEKGVHVAAAKVIWTDDSDFGYIHSSSLHNILEYEKDHRR